MKYLNQRTIERVIIGTVIVSLLFSTPVLAEGAKEPMAVPPEQEVTLPFPVMEPRPVKATWLVTATAYSSDVWQNDRTPFLPANGVDYRDVFSQEGQVNCIALNDLRLGSKVRFPDLHGEKIFTVCDRTNVRYTGKKRADFYFYAVDENGKIDTKVALDTARKNARQFGLKRKVKMEILDFSPVNVKGKTAVLASIASMK